MGHERLINTEKTIKKVREKIDRVVDIMNQDRIEKLEADVKIYRDKVKELYKQMADDTMERINLRNEITRLKNENFELKDRLAKSEGENFELSNRLAVRKFLIGVVGAMASGCAFLAVLSQFLVKLSENAANFPVTFTAGVFLCVFGILFKLSADELKEA